MGLLDQIIYTGLSGCQSSNTETNQMFLQWESSQDLNALMEIADITWEGRLFQLFTALMLR